MDKAQWRFLLYRPMLSQDTLRSPGELRKCLRTCQLMVVVVGGFDPSHLPTSNKTDLLCRVFCASVKSYLYNPMCMITSTILRMEKLSPKMFLSLGHTAIGRLAGVSPEVPEPKPSCPLLLPWMVSFWMKPCSGLQRLTEFDLAQPKRWMTLFLPINSRNQQTHDELPFIDSRVYWGYLRGHSL